jgi:hypothetical protein
MSLLRIRTLDFIQNDRILLMEEDKIMFLINSINLDQI